MTLTRDGGCRCGQIRFRASGSPAVTMACHCRGCQRMTASAYSLSALFPADAFSILSGDPVIGGLHGPTRHYFCSHCMSWLFTHPEGADAFVNVRSPMFDEQDGLDPFMETMTSEKLPWAVTSAVEHFAGFPAPSDFGRLMQAYASRGETQGAK